MPKLNTRPEPIDVESFFGWTMRSEDLLTNLK